MKAQRIALIGAGAMGANHARVVSESERATLGVVIDLDEGRASQLAGRYGFASSGDFKDAGRCDAAILAAPTAAHAEIALFLLERGVPILIEKPVAANLADTEHVCDTASRLGVPILCGFVERFNSVLDTARQVLDEDPIHIVTMRHSPSTPRVPNSVIYDLLIHDIDLVTRFMVDPTVTKVTGVSWSPPGVPIAEIADATIQFADGAVATLSASRAGQRKLRTVQIFTPTTLADIDLLRADLTVYRHVRHEQPDDRSALTYRAETIIDIPFVRHTNEPLARQFDHFLDVIAGSADFRVEIEGILPAHRIADLVEVDSLSGDREGARSQAPSRA